MNVPKRRRARPARRAGLPKIDYPFEDFIADLDELTRSGALREGPLERIFGASMPHFDAKYPGKHVRVFRVSRFMMAMHYLADHFDEFDTEDFAVYGSDRVGGLVGLHLLEAIHEAFMQPDAFARDAETDPARILARARELRDRESSQPNP